MSEEVHGAIPYKVYRGIKIPSSANEAYFDAACNHHSSEDDVFIVTYPKCGTTWVQHIVYLIFNEGRPAMNSSSIITAIPFPEQDGFPDTKYLALKYHLPLELTPFSERSKYIYVVRNPMDTCVSYYHFLKNLPGYQIAGMDVFFDNFMRGDVPYGDFFDHLLSWSKCWDKPNVLFLTFESLKENHKECVKQIASFLKMDRIAANEQVVNDIVRYSTSDYMKALLDDSDFMKHYLKVTSTNGNRNVFHGLDNPPVVISTESTKLPRMIRKGRVGDWKRHLSMDQAKAMKEVFLQRTKVTPAENLWMDIFHDI